MRQFGFLLILLLVKLPTHGQDAQEVILEGIVTDEQGAPLPYANVAYANNLRGTVCNSDGAFKLLIPSRYLSDDLTFSFLGYIPKTIPIGTIKGSVTVRLSRNSLALKEAVIKGYTGKYLIEKAVENIVRNYQGFPYINKGFYRLTTKKGDEYIHLSEAVFDIYYPEQALQDTSVRLVKMRAIKDENEARGITIGQSPQTLVSSDVVNDLKNSSLLSKKGIAKHDFVLQGLEFFEGRPAYRISFRKQEDAKREGYTGELFLDKSSLAFLRIDMEIEKEDLKYVKIGSTSMRMLMGVLGISMKILSSTEKIIYKQSADHFFLKEISRNTVISISS
ncbi:MAG: carboxypeptidase-like regulatory domain-containing protein, partial [Cyclobacteriaceae bacterium]